MLEVHSLKTKKELKNLCRQEIQILFTKSSFIKLLSTRYGLSKSNGLTKISQSDKVLRGKAFKIASDPKYDGCQRGLASLVFKFFLYKRVGKVLLTLNQIINSQMNFISRLF